MLLRGLGVRLPAGATAVMADTNLSVRDPDQNQELIADTVVVFEGPDGKVAVIAEVQKDPPRGTRHFAWPAYACVARYRHRCDVVVLVIGITRAAVRASAKKIQTGHPNFYLEPLVTGRGLLPGPGGPAFAPELTVLNVVTGDLDLSSHEARMLALVNIASAPQDRRESYTRYIRAVIPGAARDALEELMRTVIKDPFLDGFIAEGRAKGMAEGRAKGMAEGRAKGMAEGRAKGMAEGRAKGMAEGRAKGMAEGKAEGKAEGEARILLRYLRTRFTVPATLNDQVMACADTAQLEAWFDRAVKATTLEEVFAD
jgi:hypothetical protein